MGPIPAELLMEIDAPLILPEELWKIIFEKMNDDDSLISCNIACSQLTSVLKDSRQEFLFGKVILFLADHLDQQDILNCRLVCRKWTSGVDKAAENAHLQLKVDYAFPDPPNNWLLHTFTKPFILDGDIGFKNENELLEITSHPRNPFVGRKIQLNWFACKAGIAAETESMVKSFLSDFGRHLYHLDFTTETKDVSSRNYFKMICHVLNTCHSLKSLTLNIMNYTYGEHKKFTRAKIDFSSKDIPTCPNLQCLKMSIEGDWRSSMAIQDAILEKYSKQLRTLGVSTWNEESFPKLSWQKLESLVVLESELFTFMEFLCQAELPKLTNLCLEIGDFSVPLVSKFMQTLNGLPTLTSLTLMFADSFDPFEKLISEEILATGSSKTITSLYLELDEDHLEMLSFDFLAFFPFLNLLSINIRTDPFNEEIRKEVIARRYDRIQLTPFITRSWIASPSNKNPMYESNVWQVLTHLENLELLMNGMKRVYGRRLSDELKKKCF